MQHRQKTCFTNSIYHLTNFGLFIMYITLVVSKPYKILNNKKRHIWVIFEVQYMMGRSPMLQTKLNCNQPTGSREDFWRVKMVAMPIYGQTIWTWRPSWSRDPDPLSLLHGSFTWNLASIGPGKCLKMLLTTDEGQRTSDALLYYKLIHEPKSSGELKFIEQLSSIILLIRVLVYFL